VGSATSCNVLITINPDFTVTVVVDGAITPFDGIEDSLVGVLNNSPAPIPSLALTGNNIFGFDADGICTFITCNWVHPTGYEGPTTSFVVVNQNQGTVVFTPPVPPNGGFTYFSLENTPNTQITLDSCALLASVSDFYFAGHFADIPVYSVDTPDNGPGFSDVILRRDGTPIGAINANTPTQFILANGTTININNFNTFPSQNFSPFQFKPFNENLPRIGHETFQGNKDLARNKCVKVNFTSWQVLSAPGGNVVGNVNSGCPTCFVVFRTV